MTFLEHLIQKKVIDPAKAESVSAEAAKTGSKPEELILRENLIDEDSLFQMKAQAQGVPLKSINPKDVPLEVLELIPEDSAKHYRMVPIQKQDDTLEVGMVYPEDAQAQQALQFLARQGKFSYNVVLIPPSLLRDLLRHYRDSKGEVEEALQELGSELQTKNAEVTAKANLGRFTEDAPVTKMVAVILRTAVEGSASDIHIEPWRDQVRVRYRMMGELHPSLFLPNRVHSAVIARVKILAGMRIDETRKPQDGRFSTSVNGREVDFRVSTMPTSLGEKAAIRVLDPEAGLHPLEELGLEGSTAENVKKATQQAYGLILSTGPTGSGKTTTLYALMRKLVSDSINAVSLEDPVEYHMEGVSQSQIRPDLGYDFATGLRQLLRQDPDLIMVGEVRDEETASLVIHAALTGHKVLSTLHTNSAIGAVPRLLDMGVDKYLIPSTLAVVLGQRLVRKLCEGCRRATKPRQQVEDLLRKEIEEAPSSLQAELASHMNQMQLYQAVGCDECGGTGYVGRIGIFEALIMTDEMEQMVLEQAGETEFAEEAKRQGMVTMRQDGLRKALGGITTIEEVLRVTKE